MLSDGQDYLFCPLPLNLIPLEKNESCGASIVSVSMYGHFRKVLSGRSTLIWLGEPLKETGIG